MTDERRKSSPELTAINCRLDAGEARMTSIESSLATNTELTKQIAQNTAGFVAFQDDLASGTRFLCRCVKGVQFVLRDVIEPYWKPSLIVFVVVYLVTHDGSLPRWILDLIKAGV